MRSYSPQHSQHGSGQNTPQSPGTSSNAASPVTPAGPFGHQFPDVYTSYRRPYQGNALVNDASSSTTNDHASVLQFPTMPSTPATTVYRFPTMPSSPAQSVFAGPVAPHRPLRIAIPPSSVISPPLVVLSAPVELPANELPAYRLPANELPANRFSANKLPTNKLPPSPVAAPRTPPPSYQSPYDQPPPQPQPQPHPPRIQLQPTIAIGIDFGTTYSGVSWALSSKPDDIREIKHFPHLGNVPGGQRDELQVPSVYDEQNGRWGYQLAGATMASKASAATALRWFKLLLLRDEDIRADMRDSPYLQGLRKQVRGPLHRDENAAVDLVASYLGALWRHTLLEIGLQIGDTFLHVLPFRVALTVPAIWKPYARALMLEAARRAQIPAARDSAPDAPDTELLLVEEPEAAAVATLMDDGRALHDNGNRVLDVDDTCVVCDCGGGTIDVISYRLRSRDPFVLVEAAGGDGRLCGGFLADDRFEAHVLGQRDLRWHEVPTDEYQRFLAAEWEHTLKRTFCDTDGLDTYRVRLPSLALSMTARLRGKDGLVLDKETVRGFFGETLRGICRLVDEQYRAIQQKEGRPPRKIILVGGLGNSRFLAEQLRRRYGNVVQPDRCWSSVARGAVVKLLKSLFAQDALAAAADDVQRHALRAMPALAARVARCSYGVQTGVPVAEADPPREPGEPLIETRSSGGTGPPRVWRMQWYLCRGELVDSHAPVSYCFFDYVRRKSSVVRSVTIYTSEQQPPPRRKDDSCHRLCTLACPYDVPFDELPVVPGHPKMRIVKDVRLTMRFEGTPEWRLQVGNRTVSERLPVEFE